jgi:hypothetical protein
MAHQLFDPQEMQAISILAADKNVRLNKFQFAKLMAIIAIDYWNEAEAHEDGDPADCPLAKRIEDFGIYLSEAQLFVERKG